MAKTPSPQVLVQDRDKALIRMLAEDFRLLTGEQIDELFPMGSQRRRNFRLKQLCDQGYLSRRYPSGSRHSSHSMYFLGPRAWQVFDDPADKNVLKTLHKQAIELAPSALQHRMRVDSIHIRFLTARRDYPEYQLLTWVDQYSPSWQCLREYGVPIQADGYAESLLLMHFESLLTFFLEADITERADALTDKIDRYIAFAESGTYERLFVSAPFRVLFVTSSPAKRNAILKLTEARTNKYFWVTTWDDFKRSKLFDAYWMRPKREGLHSLLSKS